MIKNAIHFRSRLALGVTLMSGALGCEIIAGLGDHELATTSALDGSIDAPSEASGIPGFTIAALPNLAVLPGGTGSETIIITRTGGFSDPIAFGVLGLPSGVTADPLQITANQTIGKLTFHVALTNDQSASALSISGVSATAVGTATMNFDVRGPAGSSDLTFGNKGEAASTSLIPTDGALDANDDVIIAGVKGSPAAFASIRFLSSGVVDDKFGVVSQTFAQTAVAFRAFPIASGDIEYAGSLASGAVYLRVSSTGAFDTTFSPDGGAIGFFDSEPVDVFSADATGRIFSAGNIPIDSDGSGGLFIERRLISGAVDSTYGGTVAVGSQTETVTDSIVQSDGSLLTVCDATNGSIPGIQTFAVSRFDTNGLLDATFGSSGHVATGVITGGGKLALAPDGSIYVLSTTGLLRGLFHYSSAGVLDKTFGSSGEITLSASDIVVQSDGKILLLGTAAVENSSDSSTYDVLQVERMTTAGIADSTFGTNGFAQTTLSGGGADGQGGGDGESPVAIRIQSDGRIVVVGQVILKGMVNNGVVVDRFWN